MNATWTPEARHAVAASYLGWTLDAFDFFILTFLLPDLSAQFATPIPNISLALTLTLALRPVGAFVFGRLADAYGRRPVFAANIACYSVFAFLTAFAPSLTAFFIIRSLFGVAMGGIWGVGASLSFETIRPQQRGFVSGLMQAGYPSGYLLAALAYGFFYALVGWRGLFMLGIVPAALLIFYILGTVTESPGFDKARGARVNLWLMAAQTAASLVLTYVAYLLFRQFGWPAFVAIGLAAAAAVYLTSDFARRYWKLMLYGIALMTAFTFFSHGTQDIYPVFLQKQHHFGHATVSTIAVVYNVGAILGGLFFGMLSQRFGRRNAIIAAALLALPVTYIWAFSTTAMMLGIGAFVMQFFVQGAWGVVPAQLNELSPPGTRGTFPGTVYQLGNLIASVNAYLQTSFAATRGGDYGLALAAVAVAAALAISLVVWLGPEARNVEMSESGAKP